MNIKKGFSLLEVLVALAIFSMLALAIGRATHVQLSSWGQMKERALAGIAATNGMEMARSYSGITGSGPHESDVVLGGIALHVVTHIEPSALRHYQSIRVDVYQDGTDATGSSPVYHLTGGRYVADEPK